MRALIKKDYGFPILLISLIYFTLSFLYLLNWGLYWDDWWLTNLSDSVLLEAFRQLGGIQVGYMHLWMRLGSVESTMAFYRVAQFVCGYITVLSIYFVFWKGILKNNYWGTFATLIFMATPFKFSSWKNFFGKNFDLVAVPFIFVILKFYIFPKPYGEYADYNIIYLSWGIISEIKNATVTVFHQIWTAMLSENYLTALLVSFLITILMWFKGKKWVQLIDELSDYRHYSQLGKVVIYFCVSLIFAIFPYILIGRVGSEFGFEWHDRDTLLVPFAVSCLFILLFICLLLVGRYLNNQKFLKLTLSFTLPLTIFFVLSLTTFRGQISLIRDAIKQDALLVFIKKEPGMINN